MGFLPIFLAIAGFMFLWGTLVYNGMRSSQKRLQSLAERIAQLNLRRSNLSLAIAKEAPKLSAPLSVILKHLKEESVEEPLASWEALERDIQLRQMEMIEIDGFSEAIEQKVTELVATGKQVRKLVGEYYGHLNSYNRIILRAPHKFLARPLGFHPI